MIDILIPLGKGSRQNDLELRYCLRSVEKHLSGVGNVWIIGERPEWLRNVVHVPCQDNSNNWNRAWNIYRKIMVGINHVRREMIIYEDEDNDPNEPDSMLTNNFLFMNDDHFLLSNYNLEAAGFPYYHRGFVELHMHTGNLPQHTQYCNTIAGLGINHVLDFGVHCPIIYNKVFFKAAFGKVSAKWPAYGYEIKSMYANWYPGYGIFIDDLKFHEPAMKESIYRVLDGKPWFSVGDRCLKSGGMKEVLAELYPTPSRYEV